MAKGKSKQNTAEYVRELAIPVCEEHGLILWDVVYVKEGAEWYLRVLIDKEGGINIDDCVDVTKALNPMLDKEDPVTGEYIFEVSSCGMDRKLVKREHFEAYLEKPIRVKLIRPTEDGKKEFEGILTHINDKEDFTIQEDEESEIVFTQKECASVNAIDEV